MKRSQRQRKASSHPTLNKSKSNKTWSIRANQNNRSDRGKMRARSLTIQTLSDSEVSLFSTWLACLPSSKQPSHVLHRNLCPQTWTKYTVTPASMMIRANSSILAAWLCRTRSKYIIITFSPIPLHMLSLQILTCSRKQVTVVNHPKKRQTTIRRAGKAVEAAPSTQVCLS